MRIRSDLLLPLLLLGSCGDWRPWRSASSSPAASPETISLRLSGQVALAGSLAEAVDGAVFLIVRRAGSTSPVWMRSYLLADPLWFEREQGERVLRFGLADADRQSERGVTIGEPLELEVRYDPDGVIVTLEGVVREVLPLSPKAGEIAILLGVEDSRASDSSPRGG